MAHARRLATWSHARGRLSPALKGERGEAFLTAAAVGIGAGNAPPVQACSLPINIRKVHHYHVCYNVCHTAESAHAV